MIEPNADQP